MSVLLFDGDDSEHDGFRDRCLWRACSGAVCGFGDAEKGGRIVPAGTGRSTDNEHNSHGGHARSTQYAHQAEHTGPAGHSASWGMAAQATGHCLIGCAIGEILGMVIGTALGLAVPVTIALAVALAFLFGYSLTAQGVRRAGFGWGRVVRIALVADTASIAVMEIVDNLVMVFVPGAMHAGPTSLLFWGALALAFAVAFVVTVPVNRWMIGRGTGHAVVHGLH